MKCVRAFCYEFEFFKINFHVILLLIYFEYFIRENTLVIYSI